MVSRLCDKCASYRTKSCPIMDEAVKYYVQDCNQYCAFGAPYGLHDFSVITRSNTKRYKHVQIQVEVKRGVMCGKLIRLVSINDQFINKRKGVIKTVGRWSVTQNHHPVMVTCDIHRACDYFRSFFSISRPGVF